MARNPKTALLFPSASGTEGESFADRCRYAIRRHTQWHNVNTDPRRSVKLPAALCDAWVYQWACNLFRDAPSGAQPLFRSPSDLLALSGAVRTLAWSGTIGRTIDAGEGDLVIYIFTQPIPWSPVLGAHVPHIDDAFHLLGERSRARFKDIIVSRPQFRMPWDIIYTLNYLADTKKDPSDWISRCAFRWLRGGACFEPRLVRPLPPSETAVLLPALDHLNVPYVLREHPHPVRAPNWWKASFGRLSAQGSPEWRQKLVRFCRNAVRHLGVRGRGVDPLPIAFDETDTFEHLADLLINRANQMIRHSGGGDPAPVPDLDWAGLAPPLFLWQSDQGASNAPDAPSVSTKSVQQASEPSPEAVKTGPAEFGRAPADAAKPNGPGEPGAFTWDGEVHTFTDSPWKLLCRLWSTEGGPPFKKVTIRDAYKAFARPKKSRRARRQTEKQIRKNVLNMYGKLNDELFTAKIPLEVALVSNGGDEITLKERRFSAAKAG